MCSGCGHFRLISNIAVAESARICFLCLPGSPYLCVQCLSGSPSFPSLLDHGGPRARLPESSRFAMLMRPILVQVRARGTLRKDSGHKPQLSSPQGAPRAAAPPRMPRIYCHQLSCTSWTTHASAPRAGVREERHQTAKPEEACLKGDDGDDDVRSCRAPPMPTCSGGRGIKDAIVDRHALVARGGLGAKQSC